MSTIYIVITVVPSSSSVVRERERDVVDRVHLKGKTKLLFSYRPVGSAVCKVVDGACTYINTVTVTMPEIYSEAKHMVHSQEM